MFNCELFKSLVGKDITIVTIGSAVALSGRIVDCATHYLILSSKCSSRHYVVLDQIQQFWSNENTTEIPLTSCVA